MRCVRPHPSTAFKASLLAALMLLPLSCGGENSLEPDPDASEDWKLVAGQAGVEVWRGDLEGMIARGVIRALVPYSRTLFFLDGPRPRGYAVEHLEGLERRINARLARGPLEVSVVMVPTPRDQLLPALLAGRGDIAAGNLTITPERARAVSFSTPLTTGVEEWLVTGPSSPELETLNDLAGHTVHVRRSSSYRESLERLNRDFVEQGIEPVNIVAVNEFLEDGDLVELVHAGVVEATVVDSHKADLWAGVFPRAEIRRDLPLVQGNSIAWAVRPGSSALLAEIDGYVAGHRTGTLTGNVLRRRYFEQNRWVRELVGERDLAGLGSVERLLSRYSTRYAVDPLLMAALAYQESGLDHDQVSHAGAVGLMQVRPATARDPVVDIDDVSDLESNIHAGVKYFAHLRDRYRDDAGVDEQNRRLFALASYNAGPNRVDRLRRRAAREGLDPDRWRMNVEVVAARQIGAETVTYVRNVLKYHLAYHLSDYQLGVREQLQIGGAAGGARP